MSSLDKNNTVYSQIPTSEELLLEYQKQEENNPASIYYKRTLVRPKLHFFRVLLFCLITLTICSIVGVSVFILFNNLIASVFAGLGVLLVICIIFAKRIIIWLVMAYQRFASKERRERCRFVPSCSEYMILALQKYGLIKGLKKGINRLRRCKPPNGGVDYP
jgi:putative membrane protein insertion efficiency factor